MRIKSSPTKPFHIWLVLSLLAVLCLAQNQKPGSPSPDELHGGIEVGPKGIKSIVVRVSNGEDGYNVKIVSAEIINTTLVQTQNNKFTLEAIRETGQVVLRFYQRMQQEHRVPPAQIHIVGSSGLIGDNPQDIIAEIKARTGQTMTMLDVESEVQLAVAGVIPRRYRVGQTWYDNRSISVLIDIGSGNTKGGYQQLRWVAVGRPDYDYVTWGIPKGTVTFTNDVNKAAGESSELGAFIKHSQTIGNGSLRASIRAEVSRKPGLLNRKKVYFTGGIVWSMATLLHPEDRRSFVPLTINDLNTFYTRVTTEPEQLMNPDLSRIRDAALRNEAEKEVESVRNTFTPKNLIAGAEVMKAVAAELNFSGKQVIFARFGYLSWILSYVRLQAEQ